MQKQSLIEWRVLEHPHSKKSRDWFWYLGIVAAAGTVLAFYFGNNLFGIFIIIAAITLSIKSFRKPEEVTVSVTTHSIVMGDYEYPYPNYRSFWIEDDHMHGPRILLHPLKSYLPLFILPIAEDVDLDLLRDTINDYLDEEYLRESVLHRLFDKLGI
jgi:hypothetical protein